MGNHKAIDAIVGYLLKVSPLQRTYDITLQAGKQPDQDPQICRFPRLQLRGDGLENGYQFLFRQASHCQRTANLGKHLVAVLFICDQLLKWVFSAVALFSRKLKHGI